MSSEDLEIRLTHLEDQVSRMNIILADQLSKLDSLSKALIPMSARQKALEQLFHSWSEISDNGPSDRPPDGVNR